MSVFQLSIALGSFVGGVAVNVVNLRSSMWLRAIVLVLASLMVAAVGRTDRSRTARHERRAGPAARPGDADPVTAPKHVI